FRSRPLDEGLALVRGEGLVALQGDRLVVGLDRAPEPLGGARDVADRRLLRPDRLPAERHVEEVLRVARGLEELLRLADRLLGLDESRPEDRVPAGLRVARVSAQDLVEVPLRALGVVVLRPLAGAAHEVAA